MKIDSVFHLIPPPNLNIIQKTNILHFIIKNWIF